MVAPVYDKSKIKANIPHFLSCTSQSKQLQQAMLNIVVFGTGGVGGIFGGFLARSGHAVQFIARGEHLQAIQTRGLQIKTPQEDWVVQTANHLSSVDLILVCVKAWQLPETREQLLSFISEKTVVLPLQNGVNSSEYLAEKISPSQILRGFCAVFSYIEAPGVIRYSGPPPYLCFGEMDNRQSKRTQRLLEELSTPGIVVETPDDILARQWQKFLFISSLAAVTSVTRLPIEPLRTTLETRSLIEEAMREVFRLAIAKGIKLPNDAVSIGMNFMDEMPPQFTTSMQRDFAAGRRTELNSFSSYIAREGNRLGISTPVHRICSQLLFPFDPKSKDELFQNQKTKKI